MVPTCPECGSVRCERQGGGRVVRCQEPDCGYQGAAARFARGGPDTGRGWSCNTGWRDPVALSMDGYDGGGA